MRHMSIRLRLLLAGGIGLLIALGVAAWGLAILFDRHVERVAASDLDNRLDYLVTAVEFGQDAQVRLPTPPYDPIYQRPYSGHYWQITAPGKDLRSRSLWDYTLPLPQDAEELWRGSLTGPRGEVLLALVRRVIVTTSGKDVPLRIAVAVERAEIDAARSGFLTDLTPYLAVLALALLATLATAVTVALRPLSAIGDRVSALSDGTARRIGRDLPPEVVPLAAEIDALLEKREVELERSRLRAGDLAHGLKTPLQALMGETARLRAIGAEDAALGVEEIGRSMRSHVDRELARARRAAGAAGSSDPVEVAKSVASVLRRTPEGAQLRISVEGVAGLMVRLHRADLAEALGALAENAVRHANTRVAITCARNHDQIEIRVRDDGAGATAELLDRLPERGLRLDERREGTGLGLAIVADIAAEASGALHLRNLNPGFEAELVLPGLR
ncbi:HAMP domain-containing histidine kinase (plasmid) [Pseudorhodobacter turbinis]|uniref:histidine kinase n=1 Tax=Pseudorhodobacter turbinis TaxID=2500533 RepID=A0A4P8EIL3_9RHOB|nr:HAMP domain-containing sensor histidine kinase [Pseudorhodobacter turbinis]QCO56672.1 HAMP domain-containing histidine kinase [Pseudorhodobacter turbinis]